MEELIDMGGSPARLEAALAEHARLADWTDGRREARRAVIEFECRSGLTELTAEHTAMVTEGRVQIERMRFQERALDGLIQKIEKRYDV